MRYVGSPGSLTYLHIELDSLPSVNLVIAGEPKLWLFVEPGDVHILSGLLETRLEQAGLLYISKSCPIKYCSKRVLHKPGLFYGPEELDELGVRYSLIFQEAGDLVFIGRDVPHQVLNLGVNVADAKLALPMNVAVYRPKLQCTCPESLRKVPADFDVPEGSYVPKTTLVDVAVQTTEPLDEPYEMGIDIIPPPSPFASEAPIPEVF